MARPKRHILVRPMTIDDVPAAAQIERLSYDTPEETDLEKNFREALFKSSGNGFVAISVRGQRQRVVGFMFTHGKGSTVYLTDFAVHPDVREQGVGSAMACYLTFLLPRSDFLRIVFSVWEDNVPAQKLFRKYDFRHRRTVPRQCGEQEMDSYIFEYQLPGEEAMKRRTFELFFPSLPMIQVLEPSC